MTKLIYLTLLFSQLFLYTGCSKSDTENSVNAIKCLKNINKFKSGETLKCNYKNKIISVQNSNWGVTASHFYKKNDETHNIPCNKCE